MTKHDFYNISKGYDHSKDRYKAADAQVGDFVLKAYGGRKGHEVWFRVEQPGNLVVYGRALSSLPGRIKKDQGQHINQKWIVGFRRSSDPPPGIVSRPPKSSQPAASGRRAKQPVAAVSIPSQHERRRRPANLADWKWAYEYVVNPTRKTVLRPHLKYQRELQSFLAARGVTAESEGNFIDVKFSIAGQTFLGEIKVSTYLTPAEAFRASVGQLLDYAHLRIIEVEK